MKKVICKCYRLLYLNYLLEEGRVVNPKQIQNDFYISNRTLQRDIEELRCFYSNQRCTEGKCGEILYDYEKKGYVLCIQA